MQPPTLYIKRRGLHWVRCSHDSVVDGWQYLLLQWNPGSLTWTYYDQHDTGKILDTTNMEYFCPVPVRLSDPYRDRYAIGKRNYPNDEYRKEALLSLNTVLNELSVMNLEQLQEVQRHVEFRIRNF